MTFKPSVFDTVTPECKHFISSCCERQVEVRMSAVEAHQHPWFQMLSKTSTSPVPTSISTDVLNSLREFTHRSLLSKICLEVVAHILTNSQIESLAMEFKKFDVDNTGRIFE